METPRTSESDEEAKQQQGKKRKKIRSEAEGEEPVLTTTSLKHLEIPDKRKSLSANPASPDIISNASYSKSERSEDQTIEVVISAASSQGDEEMENDDAMAHRKRDMSPPLPPKMSKR